MKHVLSFLIGAAFGMIPFSYMIGLLRGIDIRKTGSGNIGATNLGRQLGPHFFAVGFALDALKGIVPVLLSGTLLGSPTAAGAGAILGHIFNPFFGFRGGKGVATTIGVAVAMVTRSFFLALGLWVLVYLSTFIVSLSSLVFAACLPLFAYILNEGTAWDRILFAVIALVVIFAHRSNIKRLIAGTERKTRLWEKR